MGLNDPPGDPTPWGARLPRATLTGAASWCLQLERPAAEAGGSGGYVHPTLLVATARELLAFSFPAALSRASLWVFDPGVQDKRFARQARHLPAPPPHVPAPVPGSAANMW